MAGSSRDGMVMMMMMVMVLMRDDVGPGIMKRSMSVMSGLISLT